MATTVRRHESTKADACRRAPRCVQRTRATKTHASSYAAKRTWSSRYTVPLATGSRSTYGNLDKRTDEHGRLTNKELNRRDLQLQPGEIKLIRFEIP